MLGKPDDLRLFARFELREGHADHPYIPLLMSAPGIGWVLAFTIAAAAVIGVPDKYRGEAVTALHARGHVLRIEINGASLEDIFIALTQKGAAS